MTFRSLYSHYPSYGYDAKQQKLLFLKLSVLSQIWHSNMPHNKIASRKGHQGWMKEDGPYFNFPGGGTMFPEGAVQYIKSINIRYCKLKKCVTRITSVKGENAIGMIPKWPDRLTKAPSRAGIMKNGIDILDAYTDIALSCIVFGGSLM